jgi:tetratricopeptide (TPR) repeat protein
MDSNEYVWLAPLIAFLVPAIGWGFREYWQRRNAKRQAAGDAGKILSDKKKLLEEMISGTKEAKRKKELNAQLDEVNAALLGLYAKRLRHTLEEAGLPQEEELIADGRRQLKPQEAAKLESIIAKVNALPPFFSTRDLLSLGSAYYSLGRYEEAKNIYSRILAINPYDHDAFQFRGATNIRLGKDKDALADFNRALELNPNDYVAIHDRGKALINLGKDKDALADFNRALELKPDHPIILSTRGALYVYMGKYKEALADFNRSLELRPDDPGTFYNLACFFSLWGKTDKALTYLKKAIGLDEKFREMAKTDEDFNKIKKAPRFKKLIKSG